MKALILSVSAGGGHSHAAEAMKIYLKLNNPNCEVKVVDTLKFINPIIDKVVVGGYLQTIKATPSLFGKLYTHSESDFGLATISAKINEMMSFRLFPFVQKYNPDIIICTHPFPAEMMSIIKSKNKTSIPFITILTDYAVHNFWLHPFTDAYVVSNSDMTSDMILRDINKAQIYELGIPVKPNFIHQYDKNDTLCDLNLSPHKPTILVMGGSLGMGKISNIYEQLKNVKEDIQIVVITGSNKKLYAELQNLKQSSLKETRIIGFTEKVNKYMQACDLLLTKPGGLTIAEALICEVPIAVFSPIPGVEEHNAQFLLKHNLAIDLTDINNCSTIIQDLISSKEKLQTIKNNCAAFSKPTAGPDICKLINLLIKKNKAL